MTIMVGSLMVGSHKAVMTNKPQPGVGNPFATGRGRTGRAASKYCPIGQDQQNKVSETAVNVRGMPQPQDMLPSQQASIVAAGKK
ncbi:hypothetical protein C0J09_13290 [Bordetella avium]|nr:hypothetical protein C0J09_13290 [Bordetella avium]